jgi:signal peptidase I
MQSSKVPDNQEAPTGFGGLMNPEFDFEKRYRLLREIVETVVLTLLMFLVIRFAVQNFNVDGTSMEPNLHNTELILVDKWTYMFRAPTRGDVIVFVAPPHPDMDYVKRIIGVPGDVVTIRNTTVIVDGITLNETYVDPQNQGNPFSSKKITNLKVPDGDYFVLGDNRAVSSDSRDWGFVPKQNIIGRAAFVYWPLGQDNNGFLKNYSSVFANVHQPGNAALNQPVNGPLTVSADSLVLVLCPGAALLFLRKRRRQDNT